MKMRGWQALALTGLIGCGGGGGSGGGGGDGGEVPTPVDGDNVTPLGHIETAENVMLNGVQAHGGLVFACTAAHGLQVAVTSDGALSVVAAAAAFPDGKGCRDITSASDGVLYATGQSGSKKGSWIVGFASDVSGDAVAPTLEGHAEEIVEALAANETHVFAALGPAGVAIFGKNDGALAEVSRVSGLEQALGVAVSGERLFVADGAAGLAVVDISDPASPGAPKKVKISGATARRVVINGDVAFVAGVQVVAAVDVSTSTPKVMKPIWESYGSAVDLDLAEDGLLYVANTEDVAVIDAADPQDLRLVGSEVVASGTAATPRVIGVSTEGTLAYAAEWSGLWALSAKRDQAAADVRVDRTQVDFGFAQLKKSKGLRIRNLGTLPLEVSDMATTDAVHFQGELSLAGAAGTSGTIAPGEEEIIQVTFEPEDDQPVEADLTFNTNDPDEPRVTIHLNANAADGVQVGAPFDPNAELIYQHTKTGNDVTVKGEHAGKVVLLAYFATW